MRLGEWDAKANIEPLKYVEAVVSRIRIFPLFNGANLQNDIAVLTLDREVDLNANPHINIVCPAQAATNYVNNPRYSPQKLSIHNQGPDLYAFIGFIGPDDDDEN